MTGWPWPTAKHPNNLPLGPISHGKGKNQKQEDSQIKTIGKAKSVHISKAKRGIISLPPMDILPRPGKQGLSMSNVVGEEKHWNHRHSHFLLCLNVYFWARHRMGQLSWLCLLSNLLNPKPPWWKGEETLMLCKQCSAIAKTLKCYQYHFNHKCNSRCCEESQLHPSEGSQLHSSQTQHHYAQATLLAHSVQSADCNGAVQMQDSRSLLQKV